MGLKLKQPPAIEPVTLGEAKAYLRVDGNADEALIRHLIKASRQAVEAYTNRCLIEQTWTFEINAGYASAQADDFYMDASKGKGRGGIEIPRSPFLELDSKPLFFDGEAHTGSQRLPPGHPRNSRPHSFWPWLFELERLYPDYLQSRIRRCCR